MEAYLVRASIEYRQQLPTNCTAAAWRALRALIARYRLRYCCWLVLLVCELFSTNYGQKHGRRLNVGLEMQRKRSVVLHHTPAIVIQA